MCQNSGNVFWNSIAQSTCAVSKVADVIVRTMFVIVRTMFVIVRTMLVIVRVMFVIVCDRHVGISVSIVI